MEASEFAEKQENTGIGPASACRGESAFARVFHALWHAPRVLSAAGRRKAVCMESPAVRAARPHPEERACASASAKSNVRTRVSKDEDVRLGVPSCFETHRSAFGRWKHLRSPGAAMLLSMRARGGTNLRLCEMTAGAISLLWDCYLQ
jgi:hypothetical protein